MAEIILSILTPAIPERIEDVRVLAHKLELQIEYGGHLPVEHLILMDNKRRSVGLKRDALLRAARGKYVAFVDDDDSIENDYVRSILEAAREDPDVITFRQYAQVNGQSGEVEFKLGNPDEPFNPGGVTRRNAWHVCAWRRSLAICSSFPDNSYGEDRVYAARLWGLEGLREVHIPRRLHSYYHDASKTAAPPPVA